MGRQIGFYAIGSDLTLLVEAFKSKGALVLPLRTLGPEATGEAHPYRLGGHADFLAREQDLSQVCRQNTERYGWIVDQSDCPVVEFDAGSLNEGMLDPGRLWFSPYDQSGRPKSEDFVKWASSILRTVGTTLKLRRRYDGYAGNYVGPEAFAGFSAGHFVFGFDQGGSFDEKEVAEWKEWREGGRTLSRAKRPSKE